MLNILIGIFFIITAIILWIAVGGMYHHCMANHRELNWIEIILAGPLEWYMVYKYGNKPLNW